MSVRFTSGGVGRFGFDEANATLDAADAMVGRFSDHGKPIQSQIPKPILARLIGPANDEIFGSAPTGQRFKVWNWKQVNVAGTVTSRVIHDAPQGKQSVEFGDFPEGRAIQLGGVAGAGSVVLLFRIMSADGSVWFAFTSETGGTTLLEIIGSELSGAMSSGKRKVWIYTVEMRKAKIAGMDAVFEPIAGSQQALAINLYETSGLLGAWGHGQQLEFNQLGELEPQPIEGYVLGLLTDPGQGSNPPTYVFEASNPMIPECQTEAKPSNAGQFLKRGL